MDGVVGVGEIEMEVRGKCADGGDSNWGVVVSYVGEDTDGLTAMDDDKDTRAAGSAESNGAVRCVALLVVGSVAL